MEKLLSEQYQEYRERAIDAGTFKYRFNHLEELVDYNRELYGHDSIKLDYGSQNNPTITASVGETKIEYLEDVKEIMLYDPHGLVGKPAEREFDREHFAFVREKEWDKTHLLLVKALEHDGYSIKLHVVKNEETVETIRALVIAEASHHLEADPFRYYEESEWENEMERQSEKADLNELKTVFYDVAKFYDDYQQEIDPIVKSFEKSTEVNYTADLTGQARKEVSNILAYRLVANEVKSEINQKKFRIPENKNVSKPINKNMTMELS